MAPVLIEDNIKAELPIVSHAMVVGDRRKFLSVLLTLRVILKIIFVLNFAVILFGVFSRLKWIRIRKSRCPF